VTGSYSISLTELFSAGLVADGAAFSFRAPAAGLCVIRQLSVSQSAILNPTATQEYAFDAVIARSFTVSDSGGVAVSPASVSRMSSTYPTSTVLDIRGATAGTALTAGTRTLDASPILFSSVAARAGAATANQSDETLFMPMPGGQPLVLGPNEGLIVRNKILLGAGGTVRAVVTLRWDEVASL
jgi:hypothetical protein